jgi:hypothetical protein
VRKGDRLGARPHAELVKEFGNVIANSLFADRKVVRNLRVAKAFRKQGKHLSLTRREQGKRRIFTAREAFLINELQNLIAEPFPQSSARMMKKGVRLGRP